VSSPALSGGDPPPSSRAPGRPAAKGAGRPPGPRGRLLAGTLYDYESDPAGYLTACRDAYGDIFSLTRYHVVVCRPDWAQHVLARTNREFLAGSNGLTSHESFMTPAWMLARRTVSQHRLGQHDTATGGLMRDRLRMAFERMAARPAAGVLDCQRTAAEAALHIYVSDADDHLRQLVIDNADSTAAVTSSSLSLPRWASRSRRRWLRTTDSLTGELARRAARQADSPVGNEAGSPDALRLLCQVQRPEGAERAFTSTQVARFLASTMTNVYAVAGAALSWLLVQFARFPGIADAPADAVVRETLRLHPPIWSIHRLVLESVELGGYVLEPGMSVVISPRLLHGDPRWWRDDPAVFRPARWLDPGRPAPDSHAYIPYGAGPRVCIGAQIAQAILTEAFGIIASSWQVSIDPPEPVAAPAAIVIPDPVAIRLTPR
jgi:unspecific monooxygenase